MGCFSSKHLARSRSLRDDFSMSLQRRTVGIPGLQDLFTAKTSSDGDRSGDDLLALLCTANTVATKLRQREDKLLHMSDVAEEEEEDRKTTYDSGTDEPVTGGCGPHAHQQGNNEENELVVFHEAINAWELMADLEDAEESAHAKLKPHVSRQLESLGGQRFVPPMDDTPPVDKQVISSTTTVGTTASLPTPVTPHDDDPVLEKIPLSDTSTDVLLEKIPLSDTPTDELVEDTSEVDPAEQPGSLAGSDSAPPALKRIDHSTSFPFKGSFQLHDNGDHPRKEPAAALGSVGTRRKPRVKDLKPLDVPAFEFKDIQLWIEGNEQALYDPDPYETPKFGNYVNSLAKTRRDAAAADGELPMFDADLVASLQDTLDGMTAEEERILNHFIHEFLDQVHGAQGSF